MFRRNHTVHNNNNNNTIFNSSPIDDGGDGNDNKNNSTNSSISSMSKIEPIHIRSTGAVASSTIVYTTNHNHPTTNGETTKKYTTTKHRWWSESKSTTTAHLSSLSSLLSITPSKMMIGLLLYIVCVQYSIIRTKDAAILTILTQPPPPLPLQTSSSLSIQNTISRSLPNRDLFNHKQYKLWESFRHKCDTTRTTTTTGRGVGIFPIRPPNTDIKTFQKIRNATQNVWKPYSSTVLSKVSYPIFVPSLPKSGTTSIWKYFKCGYQAACHNWIQGSVPGAKSSLLGKCMEQNIQKAVPPFQNCGPYDVYTDSGVRDGKQCLFFCHFCFRRVCRTIVRLWSESCSNTCCTIVLSFLFTGAHVLTPMIFLKNNQYLNYDHDIGEQCFYPSIDGLDAIYESYPTITFVNVVRNTEAWYNSIRNWSQASLFVRLRLCNATGFPDGQSTKKDIMKMYDNFNNMIRQFVKDRPSIT